KDEKKKKNQIFWTGPVLAGNRLWIASPRGKLVSGDVTSGAIASEQELGSDISLAPVVANQTLYVLVGAGYVRVWRLARLGAARRRFGRHPVTLALILSR